MALPKVNRLRHRRDFDVVYGSGLRRHGTSMTIRGLNLKNLNQLTIQAKKSRVKKQPRKQLSEALDEQSTDGSVEKPPVESVEAGLKELQENLQKADNLDLNRVSYTNSKSTQPELTSTKVQSTKIQQSRPTQIGISISQKVSKRAVVRNRIKRRIRAALRCLLPKIASGWMLVIVVRPTAVQCEYHQFLRELEQLLTEIEVIKKEVTDGHS